MEGIVLALFVCLILALVTKRYSLPPIPFYILGGILLGKSGLALVTSDEISHFFAQMGLIFLLFFMGLELRLDRIMQNPSTVITAGLIELTIDMGVGFIAAYMLGFSLVDSLVIASAFYVTSTALAITSLIENRKLMMREAETIIWLMVFDDLVLIIILAFLAAANQNILFLFLKIAGALAIMYFLAKYGKEFVVGVLDRSDELPLLFTFGAVLTTASFAMYIGIPETLLVIALGIALGTTDPDAFEQHARPFKDVFLVVFFVFFGITVDLTGQMDFWVIGVICIVAVLSKMLSGFLIGLFVHGSVLSGIEIGGSIIARGEFSIALASLYGSPPVAAVIAVMVVVTSIVGSFTAKYTGRLRRWMSSPGRRAGHRRVH